MECYTFLLFTLLVFSKEFKVTESYILDINSKNECLTKYFYKGVRPIYMNTESESDKYICQKLNGIEHFLTRYSPKHKIPIYSAYTIKSIEKKSKAYGSWRVEKGDALLPLKNQASDSDYKMSGFERGHLNPRYHNQISELDIKATFTLTNVVPMTAEANKEWFQVAEKPLFDKIERDCRFQNAARYIVVGVILGNYEMDYGNVNIPDYIWSAAYCDTSKVKNDLSDWSVGYLMNTNDTRYSSCTIQDLQQILKKLTGSEVKLFDDIVNNNENLSGCELVQRPQSKRRMSNKYTSKTCKVEKAKYKKRKIEQNNKQ